MGLWHLEKITFHDTQAARVFLVDWEHNSTSNGPVFKWNMTSAFKAFTRYLHDPADQLGGSLWTMFLQRLQAELNSWFSPLQQVPTKEDRRPRPKPLDPD